MSSTNIVLSRFYPNEYPKVGDIVVVKLEELTDIGVRVSLLEYGGLEGSIMLTELSRKRFRSIRRIIKIGETDVVEVIGVEPAKGIIDLSKKAIITDQERAEALRKYNERSRVHSIVLELARQMTKQQDNQQTDASSKIVEQVYREFIWDQLDDPYQYFKEYADRKPEEQIEPVIPEEYRLLEKIIVKRMKSKKQRIRAEVTINCYAPNGIDRIIEALEAGTKISNQIKITYQRAPIYELSLETNQLDQGIQILEECFSVIQTKIQELGGQAQMKTPPHSLGE